MNIKNSIRNLLLFLGIKSRRWTYIGPLWIQIDITNRCNNNCLYCWARSPLLDDKKADKKWQTTELPLPLLKNLIHDLHRLHAGSIHLSGGGEPFMHPHFIDIVRIIKEKNFYCDITTNFTLANKNIINELVKLQVNSITVSMWAGNADTYSKLHPPAGKETFYRVQELLKYLSSLKKNNKFPVIKICNVISRINFKEIEQMIDFAEDVNADAYFFQVMDPVRGKTEELLLSDEERLDLIKILDDISPKIDKLGCQKNIRVYGFDDFKRRLLSNHAGKGFYEVGTAKQIPCYAGWVFSRITADGNVNFCLKTDEFPVGNIYKNSFRRIWFSKDYAMFRKMRITGQENNRYSLRCNTTCDNYDQNMMVHEKLLRHKS